MKEIKAYIKAIKLDDVTQALHEIKGLDGASVSEVRGFGRGKSASSAQPARGGGAPSEFVRHMKLEVVCHDELEKQVVRAIQRSAHTGLRGDGKVYISEVIRSVRIQDASTTA